MSWNHSQNGLTDSDYRWFIEQDTVVYRCGHHHTPEAKNNHDFVVSSVASHPLMILHTGEISAAAERQSPTQPTEH